MPLDEAHAPELRATSKSNEQPSAAVSHNRISEAIVDQIRGLIHKEQLRPGDRLPSERELGERMGVSRVTVREAMRILEVRGLVRIRVGKGGGAVVISPSSSTIGNGLADLISLSPLSAAEVIEARQLFEVGIIPVVVDRATDEDIAALREMVAQNRVVLRDDTYGMSISTAFHVRVAACTHNAVIEMLVQSFHSPLPTSVRAAERASPRIDQSGAKEHRAFVEALGDREIARAEEIMRTHLDCTASCADTSQLTCIEQGAR